MLLWTSEGKVQALSEISLDLLLSSWIQAALKIMQSGCVGFSSLYANGL